VERYFEKRFAGKVRAECRSQPARVAMSTSCCSGSEGSLPARARLSLGAGLETGSAVSHQAARSLIVEAKVIAVLARVVAARLFGELSRLNDSTS